MRRFLAPFVLLATFVAVPRARAFVPPKGAGVSTRLDMVHVPGATYRFGAEARWQGAVPGSLPAVGLDPGGWSVRVESFFIDRTEVTAGAYASCVSAGQCAPLSQGDTDRPKFSIACTYGKPGLESHPVNCVSHDEAQAYCAFVGKRLPTDIEWELAARGTTTQPFPWGDAYPTPRHLNACDASLQRDSVTKLGDPYTSMYHDTPDDDGYALTAPVGTYPDGASPYGALDMSGNVEEWCSDNWWELSTSGPPKTPAFPDDYVVRGGAWDLNNAESFAVTRRLDTKGTTRAAWLGFRCASDG